jgi:hypothetical protein
MDSKPTKAGAFYARTSGYCRLKSDIFRDDRHEKCPG